MDSTKEVVEQKLGRVEIVYTERYWAAPTCEMAEKMTMSVVNHIYHALASHPLGIEEFGELPNGEITCQRKLMRALYGVGSAEEENERIPLFCTSAKIAVDHVPESKDPEEPKEHVKVLAAFYECGLKKRSTCTLRVNICARTGKILGAELSE